MSKFIFDEMSWNRSPVNRKGMAICKYGGVVWCMRNKRVQIQVSKMFGANLLFGVFQEAQDKGQLLRSNT
jgi:hypothetical protein